MKADVIQEHSQISNNPNNPYPVEITKVQVSNFDFVMGGFVVGHPVYNL